METIAKITGAGQGTTFTLEAATKPQHQVLLQQFDEEDETAYVKTLEETGQPVYTPEQVAEKFGLKADAGWSQSELQRLMQAGDVYFSLKKLQAEAAEVHAKIIVRGRIAMKSLMQSAYKQFKEACESTYSATIFEEIQSLAKAKLKKDASRSSIVIRAVFHDFDDKEVHVYSKALDYALFKGTAADDFIAFVEKNGNFEGVRCAAMKELPQTDAQKKAAAAREAEAKRQRHVLDRAWEFKRARPRARFPLAAGHTYSQGKKLEMLCIVEGDELLVLSVANCYQQSHGKQWDEGLIANATHASRNSSITGMMGGDGWAALTYVVSEADKDPDHRFTQTLIEDVASW